MKSRKRILYKVFSILMAVVMVFTTAFVDVRADETNDQSTDPIAGMTQEQPDNEETSANITNGEGTDPDNGDQATGSSQKSQNEDGETDDDLNDKENDGAAKEKDNKSEKENGNNSEPIPQISDNTHLNDVGNSTPYENNSYKAANGEYIFDVSTCDFVVTVKGGSFRSSTQCKRTCYDKERHAD